MSLDEKQKEQCQKVFEFLDTDKDEKLTPRQVIYGLGILGRTLSNKEQKKILKDFFDCDIDGFCALCAEKVDFKAVDRSMANAFEIIQDKDKPGYISQKDFIFVLKRFNEATTDKDINDIVNEVGGDGGYINLQKLAREMLVK